MQNVALTCHPASRNVAVRGIAARVARGTGGLLAVSYVLEGDLERLRIPAPTGGGAGERLWMHTCFELFITKKGTHPFSHSPSGKRGASPFFSYHELNFAPSGAWAAYAFQRYREGGMLVADANPVIAVRRQAGTLMLDASIALGRLSVEYVGAPLLLALTAVIEGSEGALSYWALAHPASEPDFHHPRGFVLKMDPGSSPG